MMLNLGHLMKPNDFKIKPLPRGSEKSEDIFWAGLMRKNVWNLFSFLLGRNCCEDAFHGAARGDFNGKMF